MGLFDDDPEFVAKMQKELNEEQPDYSALEMEGFVALYRNLEKPKRLDEYLDNEMDIEAYEALTDWEQYKGLFDPLEFFEQLYAALDYFKANSDSYLTLRKFVKSLSAEDERDAFFLFCLEERIMADCALQDNQVAMGAFLCLREIRQSLTKRLEAPISVLDVPDASESVDTKLLDFDYAKEKAEAYFMQLARLGFYSEEEVRYFLISNFKAFAPGGPYMKRKLPKKEGLRQKQLMFFMYQFYSLQPKRRHSKRDVCELLFANFQYFENIQPETVYNSMQEAPSGEYPFSSKELSS